MKQEMQNYSLLENGMFQFRRLSLSILYLFSISGAVPILLSGCDNSGSPSSSSGDKPTPPDPAPPTPETVVPKAMDIGFSTIYAKEQYMGSYTYSDTQQRPEGNSTTGWYDSAGNLLVLGKTLQLDTSMNGKVVKYCVTPITFDGVSGSLTCSSPQQLNWKITELNLATDWNTDTEIRSGEESNSGNIHFYEGVNITPLTSSLSLKNTLTIANSTEITHDYLSGYDFDDIYAYVKDGTVILHNNTSRSISEPVIRINDSDYYSLPGYTLKPFTDTQLTGVSADSIKSITFMDTSPAWKFNFFGFNTWDGPVSTDAIKGAVQKRIPGTQLGNIGEEYVIANQDQVNQYYAIFSMLKLAYNRFDVIKYYFDVMENNSAVDGSSVGYPFDNTSDSVIGFACPEARSVCGSESTDPGLAVAEKYIYRFHALRRMIAHAQNTSLVILSDDPNAGYGDMDVDAHPGNIQTVLAVNTDTSNLGHETFHRLGYSDKSGLTWWGGGDYNTQPSPLFNYIKNLDFYINNRNGDDQIDGSKTVVESSDYFADYLWISPTVVDVHFYSKNTTSNPLTHIAIMGGDEESLLDTPYTPGTSSDGIDSTTYQILNTDGRVTLDNKVQQIDDHTLRIYLKYPMRTHYNTLFVFASSADSNDDNGVWKTNFVQKTSDSMALQIQYDQEINITDSSGNLAFIADLDNRKDILDNGNVAHIGRNGYSDVAAPDYALSASLYKKYSVDTAEQHCKDLGYSGLGVLPASIGNELSETISKYVYGGTIVGFDHNNPGEVQVVQSVVNYTSGSAYHTKPSSFTAQQVDISSTDINLLVCAKP
jgi:hypothetical protein